MVAKEFIDFFNSISYGNRVSVEDFGDQLNLFTCVLFLIACIIISTKQYLLNAISCYIPVKPAGENFNNYLADYCWVHGTIPLRSDERMPQNPADWDLYDHTRRITYYQWVPFVLGLQCIFFYIPHIAWQALCAHRSGGDLFALVKAAADAATTERGTREKQVRRVAEFLEDMLLGHQDCRRGRRRALTRRAYDMCGICVVSKRLGTCLVFSYLAVKVITIINAIMQVYLIQRFLGFHADGSAGQRSMDLGKQFDPNAVKTINSAESENLGGFSFGLTVANHIRSGRDWPETMLFPRVAYCRVPGIRLVGVENAYTAQCALPINMLNEKIYIFFWFWIVFLIVASVLSLVLWLIRMVIAPKRKDFIKRFLRVKGIRSRSGGEIGRSDLDDFIDDYLRRDGVFLVRMLALNAGEVITAEIVTVLYQDFVKHLEELESAASSGDPEKPPLMDSKGNPSYV
ncbi:Innexin [Fasciola gigantica]|uniref:Innexin n=1 Tax=Fasciola gigantica TaxID=46835 RepID=A0A504YVX0_FASGI|nr:Innexin [Fasciola gigantica]